MMINIMKKWRKDEAQYISDTKNIRNLTAKNAMIKPVFVYKDDEPSKIIKKLKREDTNVCIVVTRDMKFVGAISDEDLITLFLHQVRYEPLTKILNVGYRREFQYKKASELINKHELTISSSTPINEVIELMYKENFQYLPVLNKSKKVIGVVTPSSILNLLERY